MIKFGSTLTPSNGAPFTTASPFLVGASLAAMLLTIPIVALAQDATAEKILEVNVTNNLDLSSGEPEIAIDPSNSRNIAIVEFAMGTKEIPASSFNATAVLGPPPGALVESGRVMVSRDGGEHWKKMGDPPAFDPNRLPHRGGGDPFIAWGPNGMLYVGDEAGPDPEQEEGESVMQVYGKLLPRANLFIAASNNGGRTFGPPQPAGTPIDRPWMTVDQSNGTLYTVSSGTYNSSSKVHNAPGPEAPNDRWLVAWKPKLAGKSEPRRLGGPDFSAASGSTFTAANGVVATTFTLGGPTPGEGFSGPPKPVAVPESLRSIMRGGVTSCSLEEPCLFFETSTDQGLHWVRHHVPVPGGLKGRLVLVSADAGHRGRYAISVLDPAATGFSILVTDDSGDTWSAPATIPESAQGANFKFWMAYGSTGVLGMVWKKQRDDLTPPATSANPMEGVREAVGPAFDVYSSVSCDGGMHWAPAVQINSAVSPAGPTATDDFTYLALDNKFAHAVWGDHRAIPNVKGVKGSVAGTQTYYGRVPFSIFAKGSVCGRR